MYRTEFIWWIGNDENRAEDGLQLRLEFEDVFDTKIDDQEWMELGCSFLELLMILSRRLSFEGGGEPRERFWELIDNLGLREYTDAVSMPVERIEEILERVIWRTYNSDGDGGLFPLKKATQDQREVELLYQMSNYILEA